MAITVEEFVPFEEYLTRGKDIFIGYSLGYTIYDQTQVAVFGVNKLENGTYKPSYWYLDSLFKKPKYGHLEKDQPVIAVTLDGKEYLRHFSHEKDGMPYCFNDGTSSLSSDKTTSWTHVLTIEEWKAKHGKLIKKSLSLGSNI